MTGVQTCALPISRREELEVDLTDENLGIGLLVPTLNIDNSVLLENRVENTKGVDLSGRPAYAVVRKLEVNGFLELGHLWWWWSVVGGWMEFGIWNLEF